MIFFIFLRRQGETLTELQRLYDELVESADTCQLDRNAAEKPVRYPFFPLPVFILFPTHMSVQMLQYLILFPHHVQESGF